MNVSQTGTIVFETERLIVRPAVESDLDLYMALWTNPDVMRHMGFPQGIPMTPEEMRAILIRQGETELDQLLVIELKATGEAIGECKLVRPGCEAIVTTPNVNNTVAIKLYEAAGAVREGEGVYQFPEAMRDFTTPVHSYTYRLSRSDWQQR